MLLMTFQNHGGSVFVEQVQELRFSGFWPHFRGYGADSPTRTACPLPHWEYRVLPFGHLDAADTVCSGLGLGFNRQDLQTAFHFWFDLYFVSNAVVWDIVCVREGEREWQCYLETEESNLLKREMLLEKHKLVQATSLGESCLSLSAT